MFLRKRSVCSAFLLAAFVALPVLAQDEAQAPVTSGTPIVSEAQSAGDAGTVPSAGGETSVAGEQAAGGNDDRGGYSSEGAPPPPGIFGGNFMFIMIAMFFIIYFVMIRPEKKRQKQRQAMLSALKKGDRVVTIGGIVGVITQVKETSYVVKSGEGSTLEFTKSAVGNVITGGEDAEAGEKIGA